MRGYLFFSRKLLYYFLNVFSSQKFEIVVHLFFLNCYCLANLPSSINLHLYIEHLVVWTKYTYIVICLLFLFYMWALEDYKFFIFSKLGVILRVPPCKKIYQSSTDLLQNSNFVRQICINSELLTFSNLEANTTRFKEN